MFFSSLWPAGTRTNFQIKNRILVQVDFLVPTINSEKLTAALL
jgi:hypothetical protein